MSIAKQENKMVSYFTQNEVQEKFRRLMGDRTPAFITSILQIVNSNDMLRDATPASVHNAAATAVTLDLPLNNTLGFAYIVPFRDKKAGTVVAQFQIGYKGYIQLAQRTGLYKRIATTTVYEGQLVRNNPLKGPEFDWDGKVSDRAIGYVAYFELLNGFEAYLYMSMDEMNAHGREFSQTFDQPYGLWKKKPNVMGKKTVLKLLLSKFAPLSIDIRKALEADQSEIIDVDKSNYKYIDNPQTSGVDKENERALQMIADCTTAKELDDLRGQLSPEYFEEIKKRKDEILANDKETIDV